MPAPSRIVIINDTVSTRGGAGKLAVQLATSLAGRGFDVTFFAGDDGDSATLERHGVNIVAAGGKALLESRRAVVDGVYNRKAAALLKSYIEENDAPDVVYHVHAWSQILSPSIFDALRPVAARCAITAHDFFLICPNGIYSNYQQEKQCALKPMSARCLLSNCDKRNYAHKMWRVARQVVVNAKLDFERAPFSVFAIQGGMVPYLTFGGLPETQISTIANPAPRLVEARVRAEDNREILYVGRLEPEKGTALLAAAARAVGAQLRIIGDGADEPAVRRAFPDAIFQGWSSEAEIAEAFTRARFFVMPSLCTEPFGLAAAEALRAGLPVLTSTSCLIGDDVRKFGMGGIVDVADGAAFQAMLSNWLKDDDAICAMSVAAFEHAGKIAQSEDQWVDDHLAHYRRMLKAAPSH